MDIETNLDDGLPMLTIANAGVIEGDEATTFLQFTITRTGSLLAPSVVTATTFDGTAIAGSDFAAVSLPVTIAAGQSTASILVPILGDSMDEPNETMTVALSNPVGAALVGQFIATGTIVDDDAVPSLSIANASVAEGDNGTTSLVFIVSLSRAASHAIAVDVTTSDGTAAAIADYTATSARVSIPAGQSAASLVVPVRGDAFSEPNETLIVSLGNPVGASLSPSSVAVGTILDDDLVPFLSIADATIAEGDGGTANLMFTITRTGTTAQAVSVTATTSAGAATAGGDYATTSSVVTVPAGQISATFAVPILGDAILEPDEAFNVTLSNPTGALLGAGSAAIGTILNDDGQALLTIANASIVEPDEGAPELVFTITRTGPMAAPVTVIVGTSDGTANTGSDYTARSNPVSIAAGEASASFAVTILGDTVVEPNETLNVLLSNPVGAQLGAPFVATGTILDNDVLPQLSIAAAQLVEGNDGAANLVFSVTRSGATAQAVSVTATTFDGTATAGGDYTAASALVTIPAGESSAAFLIPVIGDTRDESDETLIVALSNPVGATLAAQYVVAGTILDNDEPTIISIANASVVEGSTGTRNLIFTVSLSAPQAEAVSVTASTQDESARAGADYTASSSTVTIPAGQTNAIFSVPVGGDATIEIDESLAVLLSDPIGGAAISASAGAARGFILNDDAVPSILVNGQTLNGTSGDDFLVAGALNDSVRGEGGADTEFGNEQNDVLFGGAGNDFILGDFAGNFLDGSADFIDAGDGNDNVFAGGGNDTVFGGSGDDLIGGDFGDNLIFGGDGNNALFGFGGADTIQGGNDGDIVFGLSGPDVIVTKGGFDLVIAGGDLDGPTDADFIDVADGGSQVFAGSGDDTIIAGEGPDFMLGESGADRITGGGGADVVIAGPGNDTLDGGAGNDLLIAEGGNDVLAGGLGEDVFRYPSGIAVNADRITDFAPGDDTVELGAALGFATTAAALTGVSQNGPDAVLTFAAGSITFVGVMASALSAADFAIM